MRLCVNSYVTRNLEIQSTGLQMLQVKGNLLLTGEVWGTKRLHVQQGDISDQAGDMSLSITMNYAPSYKHCHLSHSLLYSKQLFDYTVWKGDISLSWRDLTCSVGRWTQERARWQFSVRGCASVPLLSSRDVSCTARRCEEQRCSCHQFNSWISESDPDAEFGMIKTFKEVYYVSE